MAISMNQLRKSHEKKVGKNPWYLQKFNTSKLAWERWQFSHPTIDEKIYKLEKSLIFFKNILLHFS